MWSRYRIYYEIDLLLYSIAEPVKNKNINFEIKLFIESDLFVQLWKCLWKKKCKIYKHWFSEFMNSYTAENPMSNMLLRKYLKGKKLNFEVAAVQMGNIWKK